jgi:hypothetical protein
MEDEDGRDFRCLVLVIFGELKGARAGAGAGDIFRYHVPSQSILLALMRRHRRQRLEKSDISRHITTDRRLS